MHRTCLLQRARDISIGKNRIIFAILLIPPRTDSLKRVTPTRWLSWHNHREADRALGYSTFSRSSSNSPHLQSESRPLSGKTLNQHKVRRPVRLIRIVPLIVDPYPVWTCDIQASISQVVASRTLLIGYTSSCFLPVGFAHEREIRQELFPLGHFGRGFAFLHQRAGRTDMNTFPATGAGLGFPPGLVQVGNDLCLDSASHHIPGMRPFDLITHPHAAGTQDAAVGVMHEQGMRGIHLVVGIPVGNINMGKSQFLCGSAIHSVRWIRRSSRCDCAPT